MQKSKIRYLVDENGRKSSVVLSIKEYEELLEDLADLGVIAERKDEPAESLEDVTRRLEDKWRSTPSK
jgi:hypothetical protein